MAGPPVEMAFARRRATVILCFLVIWFSMKSRSWMILFGSLLDQFVGSANWLSIFQYDAVQFISVQIDGFSGLGTVDLSLFSENPRSRFMLELMLLLCWFSLLKRVARSLYLMRYHSIQRSSTSVFCDPEECTSCCSGSGPTSGQASVHCPACQYILSYVIYRHTCTAYSTDIPST